MVSMRCLKPLLPPSGNRTGKVHLMGTRRTIRRGRTCSARCDDTERPRIRVPVATPTTPLRQAAGEGRWSDDPHPAHILRAKRHPLQVRGGWG